MVNCLPFVIVAKKILKENLSLRVSDYDNDLILFFFYKVRGTLTEIIWMGEIMIFIIEYILELEHEPCDLW